MIARRISRCLPALTLCFAVGLLAVSWCGTASAEDPPADVPAAKLDTKEAHPAADDAAADKSDQPAAKKPDDAKADDAKPADAKPADSKPAAPAVIDASKSEAKAAAEFKATGRGRLIRVPLPITGTVDTRVQRTIQKVVADLPKDGLRPVLILELQPVQSEFGQGSTFGRALELAEFLSSRELSSVKTVAYIPKSIRGHAVLVAMACEEIVMAPTAELGDASADEAADQVINSTVKDGYRRIAGLRRTIPPEVAAGMLDKSLEVLVVETDVSREFVLRGDLDELRKRRSVQSETVLKPPGQLARFTGREARELGFAKYLAADRVSLARALGLPPEATEEDPANGGDVRPIRVQVQGPIHPVITNRAQRTIEDQLRDQSVNFVCLWIDSPGGSLPDSMGLATFLASQHPGVVRTVAYVSREAKADAALIALACDHLVMEEGAMLGGPSIMELPEDEVRLAVETLRNNVAKPKSRSWSLMAAMIDPQLKVYRYTHKSTGRIEFFCEEEAEDQADPESWLQGQLVSKPGETLRLKPEEAEEFGLARNVVQDFNELRKLYNLENDPALVEPGWADTLIDALAAPAVAWLLLLIGGAALYAELHSPGIGVGAFIAGVAFLLYFWSKHLDGTAGWLEVLLFIAGISCVLLEIFVLPGAGIFALGGGFLVIISLVLASQTFVLPHNDYELGQLRNSLVSLAGAAVSVTAIAVLIRRFLPHAPMFNRMMLEPPSGEELEQIHQRESLVAFNHLMGQRGKTTTPLAPAGKARFGNDLVDVISNGDFVARGDEVEVIEVHGNRIIVQKLS